jgi:glycosidase
MIVPRPPWLILLALRALLLGALLVSSARAETILQYFNTSWKEIERRIPEVAEAGYTSLWLPPPAKASAGAYSVGYDPLDRFDLGDKDQAGTIPTRYGTKGDLLRLIEVAHRFGLRIYFDNVMAHNAGPLDDVPAGTLLPGVPGFVPEDFHLVRREGGGWRKASDSVDYNDEWQVLNRNPFAWDIAHENPNTSFDPTGQQEGKDYPKWIGIRHPGARRFTRTRTSQAFRTERVLRCVHLPTRNPLRTSATARARRAREMDGSTGRTRMPTGSTTPVSLRNPLPIRASIRAFPARQTVAWGHGDGRYNMGNPVPEDVNAMLIRSARWTIDQTRIDGFRLDAVKHVPSYFFGHQGDGKDRSSAGFLGGAHAQFNLTHGYTDWANHRNALFSTDAARDDLMLFGEHLGAPPNPDSYLAAGMRIANDDFINNVGGFGGIGASLGGYDNPGQFTFGVNGGATYALSHDNNHMSDSERPAAHQYMLTRAGLPIVYTDGFNISSGPDYFPKPSYTPFLGQYGKTYITGTLPVRRDFIRGDQYARWSSRDFAGWEFRDYRENPSMSASDATTLVVMHARNYTNAQPMPFGTAFAAGCAAAKLRPLRRRLLRNGGKRRPPSRRRRFESGAGAERRLLRLFLRCAGASGGLARRTGAAPDRDLREWRSRADHRLSPKGRQRRRSCV